MKKRQHDPFFTLMRIAGLLAMLLGAELANADMLAVTAGRGNIESQGPNAVFLSYQKDAPGCSTAKVSTT